MLNINKKNYLKLWFTYSVGCDCWTPEKTLNL